MDHIVLAAAEEDPQSSAAGLAEIILGARSSSRSSSCSCASSSCRTSRRRSPSARRPSRAASSAAETKQAEADAKLAELEKQLADARHEAARIREEAREQGAADHRRDAGAGPGRVRADRRARQDADRGRAPAGGHLAPRRGRRPRDRPGRSHRGREPGRRGSPEPRGRAVPRRARGAERHHLGGVSTDDARSVCRRLRRGRRGPPGSGDLGKVAQDLFGVSDLVRSEPGLRRVATDASVPGEAKAQLLRGVLTGRSRPRPSTW